MNNSQKLNRTRRKFLRMLAASPVLAGSRLLSNSAANLLAAGEVTKRKFLGWFENLQQSGNEITSADQALNVMDFEAPAKKALPAAHWGYLETGVDDDATVKANHDGYSRIQIRSRRLVDVTNIDMSTTLFGTKWDTPILLSPVSSQKAFHPEGEVGVAKAAGKKGHVLMISTVASCSIEETLAASGKAVWQQLYPTNVWEIARAIVKRAEAAGSPAIVLTVDLQDRSNRETLARNVREDKRECAACHTGRTKAASGRIVEGFAGLAARRPMLQGLDISKVSELFPAAANWDLVKRLRDMVQVKLIIKGIVTKEDAQLAVEHGADAVMVSNHGGRAEDTLRPTIECLPEVVEGVAGKVPVIIDGGVRRGTDIFKALALGATAVSFGRPQSWGLAAFGPAGVEAVLEIYRRELRTIMRQAGTTSLDKITRSYVVTRPA